MAKILATIQSRRGAKQDFDATRMKAGEFAVATDGSDEAYVATQDGRVIEFLKAILGKADKKIPAASGNLAALDGSGNLLDTGKKYPAAATTSADGLMAASDKTKLNGVEAGAQKNTVTGVKGSSESSYRTGNVSISAENVGAITKVSPATAGNLPALTATGELSDSGKKPTPAGLGALPGVESSTAGCYTRTVDGVTEWINPPMVAGVEYRTAERWNGKPVYTKLLQYTNSAAIGSSTGVADIEIPHGITNCDTMLSAQAIQGQWLLPFVNGTVTTAVIYAGSNAITMRIANYTWAAGKTWSLTLRYTKR